MNFTTAFLALLIAYDPLFGIELPPPEFDYQPTLPVVEVNLDLNEIHRTCSELNLNHLDRRLWGCAHLTQYWCLTFVPTRAPATFINLIRRHERAHCNGWKH